MLAANPIVEVKMQSLLWAVPLSALFWAALILWLVVR
jgi:hypothetical protein